MKKAGSYGAHEDIVLRAHIELSRAFLKLRAKETAWMVQWGLTMPQFAILEALYHLGPLRVGEITELILSTPGNITVVIKNLEAREWIRVYPFPKDRRIRMVELTETGVRIVQSLFPGHLQNLVAWFDAGLDETELKTLSGLLRRLGKAQ